MLGADIHVLLNAPTRQVALSVKEPDADPGKQSGWLVVFISSCIHGTMLHAVPILADISTLAAT